MNSSICDLLNIKYPIFQGGMAWVSDSSLAAAVSNAGGLGIIAGANAPCSAPVSEADSPATVCETEKDPVTLAPKY